MTHDSRQSIRQGSWSQGKIGGFEFAPRPPIMVEEERREDDWEVDGNTTYSALCAEVKVVVIKAVKV